MATGDGHGYACAPAVVEPGHHHRRLLALTGLDAQENQARRLLNDILRYRARLSSATGGRSPEPVAALRWLVEVYEPAMVRHARPSCAASWNRPRCSTRSWSTGGSCRSRPVVTSVSTRLSPTTSPTS